MRMDGPSASPPAMFCLQASHSSPPSQMGCKHHYCEAPESFRGFFPALLKAHLQWQQYCQAQPRAEKDI